MFLFRPISYKQRGLEMTDPLLFAMRLDGKVEYDVLEILLICKKLEEGHSGQEIIDMLCKGKKIKYKDN